MESLPPGRILVPRHHGKAIAKTLLLFFWDDILIHIFMASESTFWEFFSWFMISINSSEVSSVVSASFENSVSLKERFQLRNHLMFTKNFYDVF